VPLRLCLVGKIFTPLLHKQHLVGYQIGRALIIETEKSDARFFSYFDIASITVKEENHVSFPTALGGAQITFVMFNTYPVQNTLNAIQDATILNVVRNAK
jgi:hypothetical protein